MPSEPTAVDCINSLLEDYKSLFVEKRALEELLLQLDVPDQLERYNRAHAENWRKLASPGDANLLRVSERSSLESQQVKTRQFLRTWPNKIAHLPRTQPGRAAQGRV
jgi:hypothetical protein